MPRPSTRQIGFITAQIIAVAALMISTLFLHRVAEFSAVCFKSQLVDRLVLFSEQGEIPHCEKTWGWSGDWQQIPDHWALHWPRVMAKAERLTEVWPLPERPLKMVVVSEEPFISERDGAQIIVGGTVAAEPRTWLRELVRAWVEDTTLDLLPLEQAVLSDFFTAVAEGEFVAAGMGGLKRAASAVNWNTSAIRPEEYCLSPWRDVHDYDFCLSSDPGEPGRLRGLKALFGRALWELYKQADWEEQRRLWRWLRSDVALAKSQLIKLDSHPLPASDRLSQTLATWSKRIFSTPERQARALYLVKSRLGLKAAASPFLVIEADRGIEAQAGIIQSLVRIDGELEWWSRGDRVKAFDPTVWPLHLVKVSCELPSIGELAHGARKTVLLVRSCHSQALAGLDSLSLYDFKSFIAANPGAGILWLNVQGLRQALKENGVRATARVSLKQLRHWSHWQEDAWDKAALAFKPRAGVDLVLSHRATRDLL